MAYVIGICGGDGQGKTTWAKDLRGALEGLGLIVEEMAYADPLYGILRTLGLPCPPDSGSIPELGRAFKSGFHRVGDNLQKGRDLLIAVGEAGRAIDPLVWTNVLRSRVWSSKADVVLIPDVRFVDRGEHTICDELWLKGYGALVPGGLYRQVTHWVDRVTDFNHEVQRIVAANAAYRIARKLGRTDDAK